jgi:hypothetical protein
MNDLRKGWENIDEFAGIPGIGITSVEKFKQGRSISIAGKVRGIFVRDFIYKSLAFLFIVLNLVLNRSDPDIRLINAILGVLWIIFTLLGIKFYREFKRSADPARSSRENLSSLLSFLTRRFPYAAINAATTYVCTFLPGILFYFVATYGYLKHFTTENYIVFSFLGILGTVSGYILDMRSHRHHIQHIKICLSDLNDNALALASQNIEMKRKMDHIITILVQVIILLAFLGFIAIFKSVLT